MRTMSSTWGTKETLNAIQRCRLIPFKTSEFNDGKRFNLFVSESWYHKVLIVNVFNRPSHDWSAFLGSLDPTHYVRVVYTGADRRPEHLRSYRKVLR